MTALDLTTITPLITGGGSGIGLGLAREFLQRAVLQQGPLQGQRRGVSARDQQDLSWTGFGRTIPRLQRPHQQRRHSAPRRVAPVNDDSDWDTRARGGNRNQFQRTRPLVCTLLPPALADKVKSSSSSSSDAQSSTTTSVLANVSSGLAFVPFAAGPVYSATNKAAIHSYTMALRYSLQDTNVRVVEIVPPAVKTHLGGGGHDFGEDLDEYAAATVDRLAAGEAEIGCKFSETARRADCATLDGCHDSGGGTHAGPEVPFRPQRPPMRKHNKHKTMKK